MEFYLNNDKIKDKSITKEKLAEGVITDSEATTSSKGLMSSSDKKKLDSLTVTNGKISSNNLPTASTTQAGIMSAADKTKLDNYGFSVSLDGGDTTTAMDEDAKGNPTLAVAGKGIDIVLAENSNTGYQECVFSLSNNAVTSAKVADKAITKAKLEQSLQTKLDSMPTAIPTSSTQTWGKGCPQVGSDGVMEVGKYIDMHNSADSSKDFDVRIMCNNSTGNTLVLPNTSGNLVVESNMPLATASKVGSIKVGNGLSVTSDGTLSLGDIFVLGYYDRNNNIFRSVKGEVYTRDFTVDGGTKSAGSWLDSIDINTGKIEYEGFIEGDTSKIYIDQTYDTLDLYRYTGNGYVQLNTYPPVILAGATDTWGKGVPAVGSDGVMDVGKYIDFHSTSNSNTDYNIRLISEATGKILLKLPNTGGTLALQADVEELSNQIDDAVTQLNEASDQMNHVNAELNGDVLTVTDKNNVKTSVNLVDNYEKVTVQLSTSVSGVTLNNLTLNVYINHDTNTPITYTTDANGKAEFQVAKGSYYQVTFPDKANCEHIAPIGYTATVSSRTINAEYKKISEEHLETVNVYVRYYNQSTTATAFSGIEVTCTVNGTATKTTTDDKGLATFTVAWGKEYTISVPDNYNNYYLWYRSPSTTQTSENSSRALYFNYYPFEAGVFIVTDDGEEFTAEQWETAGLPSDRAVLIKVLTNDLVVNSRTVYIDAQMTQTGYKNAQWQAGNSNYLLTLPDGANTNDGKVVTDGYIASAAAAESGGISTPAMSLAVTYTATVDTSEFRGYLGTNQQWNQFWSNIDLVDECITNIFGDSAKTFQKNYTNAKWTSTQLNSDGAYYWGTSLGGYNKVRIFLVVPFLAILPTN